MHLPLLGLLVSGWPAARLPSALGRTLTTITIETTTAHSSFAQTDWPRPSGVIDLPSHVKREAPQSSDVTLSDMIPAGSATATATASGSTSASSGALSPSSSTAPGAGDNGTISALALAQSLLTASSSSCLSPGGGCAVLNLTLPECLDDTCACADATTLAAMVCTQCNAATDTACVGTYNTYLRLCEQMGIAAPSDTLLVSLPGAATVSDTGSAASSGPTPSVVVVGLHASASAGAVTEGGAVSSAPAVVASAPSSSAEAVGALVDTSPSSASSASGEQTSNATPSTGGPAVGLVTDMPTTGGPPGLSLSTASSSSPALAASAAVSGAALQPSRAAAGIQLDASTSEAGLAGATSHAAVALLATDMSGPEGSTSSAPGVTVTASPLGSGPSSTGTSSELLSDGRSSGGESDPAGSSLDMTAYVSMSTLLLSPSAGVSGAAGIQVASNDTTNSTEVADSTAGAIEPTAALNASVAFFGYDIDSKCDTDCAEWKQLAGDACICTDAAILSAGSCSSCLGSTTHGETYAQQIGFYSAFTSNCSMAVSGSTPSNTVKVGQYGYEDVPAATSSRLGAVQGVSGAWTAGQANGTAAAAGEVVETQYVGSGVRTMTPTSAVLHCLVGMVSAVLFGMTP